MNFLPFEKVSFDTKLTQGEVMDKMCSVTEKRKIFRFGRLGDKPYEGEVGKNTFHVTRILDYRNGFKPEIEGRIISGAKHTRVNLMFRMHKMLLIVGSLFFFICFPLLIYCYTGQVD